MSFLLWSCLNAGLLLLFLYAGWKVAVALAQKIGPLFTTIFVLGVLTGAIPRTPPHTPSLNLLHPVSASPILLSDSAMSIRSSLTKRAIGPSCTLTLLATTSQHLGKGTPQCLSASVDGFIGGHTWEPVYGSIKPQGSRWTYFVTFQHKWKLFNYTLLTTHENYEGLLDPMNSVFPEQPGQQQ